MTLAPALARLERGFRRMWAWARDPLGRRRKVTEGQEVTAQETETMLGLMSDASAAGDAMSDEQRLMLIQAAPGMRAREAVLLGIPNRSSVEENELHMIRREMARIEGRDQPQQPRRIMGFAAAPAALGLLGGVRLWMILAAGWALTAGFLGIQMSLKERIEDQRDEARADLAMAERHLRDARTVISNLSNQVNNANEDNAQTAAMVEAERARRLRAEREAARIRNEMERARAGAGTVDYGFGSVRDAGPEGSPGAGSGNPTGDRPG